jgi:hypothetical protein
MIRIVASARRDLDEGFQFYESHRSLLTCENDTSRVQMDMKRVILTSLAAVGVLINLVSRAESADQPRTDINPALQYYQAFLARPQLEPNESEYLFMTNWQGQTLDERFNQLIARYDLAFNLLCNAAVATVPCDWGVDLSRQPISVTPRLAAAKSLVQVARLRAHWHLENGRQLEAKTELLAALALGHNLSRDGLEVSTLTQFSIDALFALGVAENFYLFETETLRQLAGSMESAPARATVRANDERGGRSELATATQLAMIRAAISYKIDGESGFRRIKDPGSTGPFELRRLMFEGVDRGFQLISAVHQAGYCDSLGFLEKPGKPFILSGPSAGQPILDPAERTARRYGLSPPTVR